MKSIAKIKIVPLSINKALIKLLVKNMDLGAAEKCADEQV